MTDKRLFTLSNTPLPPLALMPAAMRLFFSSFLPSLPYACAPVFLLIALCGAGYGVSDEEQVGRAWALYVMGAVLLLSPALMAPLIYRIHAIAHGRPVSAREAFGRGVRCFLPCLIGAAMYMLAAAIGSILLLLPGLYLSVALAFWWLGVVIDDLPVLKAFTGSLRLVSGHWWHTVLGFSYLYGVAFGVNAFDVNMISLGNELVELGVTAVLSVLLTSVLPIFVSANMVVVHNDLSLRRAGVSEAPVSLSITRP